MASRGIVLVSLVGRAIANGHPNVSVVLRRLRASVERLLSECYASAVRDCVR